MYQILLLHEENQRQSRLRDYVQLCGYSVWEGLTGQVEQYSDILKDIHLILLECETVERCFSDFEILRSRTWLPIMVVSERDDEWEKVRILQAGADDYLAAPYSQIELVARVRAHINQFERMRHPFEQIVVRDLVIQIQQRRVIKNGKAIYLRLREFDVLLYLARHPNEVIAKEQIYREVWQMEADESACNTVAVHIKRVRHKLEEDAGNPVFIETVWGIGYRFLA